MTTYTAKELIEKFIARDEKALAELNSWMFGPVTESRRLDFLEGRVKDLCGVVFGLAKIIEDLEHSKESIKVNDKWMRVAVE